MTVVLIVDDEPVSRLLATHMVDAMGFETYSVSGVHEALSAIDTVDPDIIVTDYLMDDGTGLDLAEALAGRTHAPVVLLSGVVERFTDERADLLAAHLTKPVRSTELRAVLDSLLATEPQAGTCADSKRQRSAMRSCHVDATRPI